MVMSDVLEKWGKEVAERGFAQIPNYLLLINQFLAEDKRLSPGELNVLLQLVGSWWRVSEMPFPSLKTIAVRAGISDRQAQRAVTRLETLNLIKRTKRKGAGGLIASNAYDLAPLVQFLGKVAKAFPNEFPRKITPKIRAELDNALVGAGNEGGTT
jgi:predicted transcriptional regulator